MDVTDVSTPPTPGGAPATGPVPFEDDDDAARRVAKLRVSAAQGVKWSFIQTVGSQVGRLAFTFVLVRLMGPSNFGVIAQATIYIGLTMVFLDQGFSAALVQKRTLDEADI